MNKKRIVLISILWVSAVLMSGGGWKTNPLIRPMQKAEPICGPVVKDRLLTRLRRERQRLKDDERRAAQELVKKFRVRDSTSAASMVHGFPVGPKSVFTRWWSLLLPVKEAEAALEDRTSCRTVEFRLLMLERQRKRNLRSEATKDWKTLLGKLEANRDQQTQLSRWIQTLSQAPSL